MQKLASNSRPIAETAAWSARTLLTSSRSRFKVFRNRSRLYPFDIMLPRPGSVEQLVEKWKRCHRAR